MARGAQAFERNLKIATASLEPAAISALLARTAREALAEAIAAGEASPNYVRSVNGRFGAAEETVVVPGPIIYRFSYLEDAVVFALAYCEARSPFKSGRYRKSWFALVNGALWRPGTPIPPNAEAIVTNDQPYHRKIEVGAMKMSVPPRIVEGARQALFEKFGRGVLKVERQFVWLHGGYVLKGRRRSVRAAQNNRSSAFRGGRAFLSGRADTAAGEPMTYPALLIRVAENG